MRQKICGRKRPGKLFLARLGHRFGCVLRRLRIANVTDVRVYATQVGNIKIH